MLGYALLGVGAVGGLLWWKQKQDTKPATGLGGRFVDVPISLDEKDGQEVKVKLGDKVRFVIQPGGQSEALMRAVGVSLVLTGDVVTMTDGSKTENIKLGTSNAAVMAFDPTANAQGRWVARGLGKAAIGAGGKDTLVIVTVVP